MSATTGEIATAIRPFHVEFSEERIDDLRRRIAATRWPSKELVDERSQGVQLAAAQALARYWLDEYDFGRVEARLNELPQFVTQIDGVGIHFIHVMSSHENALPLTTEIGARLRGGYDLLVSTGAQRATRRWRVFSPRSASGSHAESSLRQVCVPGAKNAGATRTRRQEAASSKHCAPRIPSSSTRTRQPWVRRSDECSTRSPTEVAP